MLSVGFTGPRTGMTAIQEYMVANVINNPRISEIRHGDCIGADEFVHSVALKYGKKIFVHPPTNPRFRAFCAGPSEQVIIFPEEPYHSRNKKIVKMSMILLSGPRNEEVLRSGTWSTIRYARTLHSPRLIIGPNGEDWSEEIGQSDIWPAT